MAAVLFGKFDEAPAGVGDEHIGESPLHRLQLGLVQAGEADDLGIG